MPGAREYAAGAGRRDACCGNEISLEFDARNLRAVRYGIVSAASNSVTAVAGPPHFRHLSEGSTIRARHSGITRGLRNMMHCDRNHFAPIGNCGVTVIPQLLPLLRTNQTECRPDNVNVLFDN